MVSAKFSHIKTWLFDLDHTLFPAETNIVEAFFEQFYQYVVKTYNLPYEEAVTLTHKYYAELGNPLLGFQKHYNLNCEGWYKFCDTMDISHIPICDKTIQFLEKIPGKKVIFTNGHRSHTTRILNHLKISHCFDAISCMEDEVRNMRFKPDPNIYSEILTEINAIPQTTAMVEDYRRNLEPAFNLGLTTVLVNNKQPKNYPYITHQYPTLVDFLEDV